MAYTASATSLAGRNGHVESSDKVINFDLAAPAEMGGTPHAETSNPEQLFAAAYAACFGSALGVVARQEKVEPEAIRVRADVTIDQNQQAGYFLSVKLHGELLGVDHAVTEALMQKAHEVCPYSKATRGNIKVELEAT